MRLKAIIIGLGILGLSASIFASAGATPTGVTLVSGNDSGVFSVSASAIYAYSNTGYYQYASLNGQQQQANKSLEPDSTWGGQFGLSYLFANSDYDLNFSYFVLNQSNSNTLTSATGTNLMGTNGAGPFSSVDAHMSQVFDNTTLTLGRNLHVGTALTLHPYMGLAYGIVDVNGSGDFYAPLPHSDRTFFVGENKGKSSFNGLGPRFGLDATAQLNQHFSVVGGMGFDLLVGDLSEKTQVIPNPVLDSTVTQNNQDYTTVVPELDAKLGLNYNVNLSSTMNLDTQVGFQAADYFGAESFNSNDAFYVNSQNAVTNASYYGPYLSLRLNINS